MSIGDTIASPIDIVAFLQAQRGEREPAILVHGPPLAGKSTFARRLAEKEGMATLDLLEHFARNARLAGEIDQADPARLRRLILDYADTTDASILLVDEVDFLLRVWGDNLVPFREMVRRLRHPTRAVAFAIFVQTRPELDTWSLVTAARRSRVLRFEEVGAV
jgi:GTPase SAR1 family protein